MASDRLWESDIRRAAVARPLQIALRRLGRSPLFAVVMIATLAVGIGANTAVFSVVDGVLLRPLPFPEADRLAWINFSAPGLGYEEMPLSKGVYLYMGQALRSLQRLALFKGTEVTLNGEGEPLRVTGAQVTPGFFQLLRVSPALGRAFTAGDGAPGAEPVVLVSHALWATRFGGDSGVVGRTVTMDGVARRVIGVAPAGFAFPDAEDQVWLPLLIDPSDLSAGDFAYPAVGRLKPGETLASARADIQRLVPHIGDVVPDLTPAVVEKARFAPVVRSLKERVVGDLRRPLWVILGTGAFVLVIACANVANLFLVRAESRGREFALRAALGAERADLAGLLLGESLLLAITGGALGLGLALVGVKGLLALAPAAIPRAGEISLNGDVLLFTLGVSVLVGLVFGSLPVLRRQPADLSAVLKEGGRSATVGHGRGRVRSALVVIQIALSLVLLVGAGLMLRTFQAIRSVDPGFRPDHVLTFDLTLPPADYPTAHDAATFWRAMIDRIRVLPGVRAATVTSQLPLGPGIANGTIMIDDHPISEGELAPVSERKYVSPAYFATLGIPLLQGRALDPRDGADRVRAAVVNRSFARHWWPRGTALGHRIRESPADPWYEIVGVVGDVRFQSLKKPAGDEVYFPLVAGPTGTPRTPRAMAVAIRAAGAPTALMAAVRKQVWALDSRLPIAHVRTLRSLVNDSMARTSFTLVMLGIAATVALLLGMVGIYGVISYLVGQRRREIGVRMALGATARNVSGMVVRQGLTLAAFGIALGLAAAFGLNRLLTSLLFGVSASDPMTYGAVALALLGVATLASYLPARRASMIDPVVALREE